MKETTKAQMGRHLEGISERRNIHQWVAFAEEKGAGKALQWKKRRHLSGVAPIPQGKKIPALLYPSTQ